MVLYSAVSSPLDRSKRFTFRYVLKKVFEHVLCECVICTHISHVQTLFYMNMCVRMWTFEHVRSYVDI